MYMVPGLASRFLSRVALYIPSSIQCVYRSTKRRLPVSTEMCTVTLDMCGEYGCYETNVLVTVARYSM